MEGDKTIQMTSEELDILKGLIDSEIDSVRVIDLKSVETETPYTKILAGLEKKLAT